MSQLGDLLRAQVAVEETKPQPTYSYGPDDLVTVGPSAELDRVVAIPRRPLLQPDEAEALVEQYTALLRKPDGQMRLRPLQAQGLHEAQTAGGLLGPIGVGEGKTLLALLLPMVMKSERAVMLVPSSLRDQVQRKLYGEYITHWKLPQLATGDLAYANDSTNAIWVIGYSELSTTKGQALLEQIKPDLIICDEAHMVARYSAARTKRFLRYFKAHPWVRLVALSGTLISRSIKDVGHLGRLTLRRNSPYPSDWRVSDEWARVLDPSDALSDQERQEAAGELLRLCEPDEPVRSGFARRVIETPGVVASTGEQTLPCALRIQTFEVKVPKVVQEALARMAETWETPWGEVITDALSYHRYVNQLAAGLNYLRYWPHEEPEAIRKEWLEARAEWHREIRAYLAHHAREGMDSPKLLALAANSGKWKAQNWHRWDEIRHQAKPATRDVWLSDFLVSEAAAWGRKNVGVIWYEHQAVGREIAKLGGFPNYGAGADSIIDEDGSRTVCASIRSHHYGKNLQQWSRALVISPPSPAKTWEQLLGRHHRTGQKADEVVFEIALHVPALSESFGKTLEVARFLHEIELKQQRLMYADLLIDGSKRGG